MGDYSSSPGAIYPALRRLEDLGLIEGEIDAAKSLRPKKVFRLTPSGEKTLAEWLNRRIEHEDVKSRLHEGRKQAKRRLLPLVEQLLRLESGSAEIAERIIRQCGSPGCTCPDTLTEGR